MYWFFEGYEVQNAVNVVCVPHGSKVEYTSTTNEGFVVSNLAVVYA